VPAGLKSLIFVLRKRLFVGCPIWNRLCTVAIFKSCICVFTDINLAGNCLTQTATDSHEQFLNMIYKCFCEKITYTGSRGGYSNHDKTSVSSAKPELQL